MGKPCAQCGKELSQDARVCSQCGAPVQAMPTAAQTMIGFSSPLAPPVAQPQPPAPAPAPAPAPMAQTMLGFAAPDLRVPPAQPAPPPAQPAPLAAGMKTMLGVAAPGIAPAPAPQPQPQPQPAAKLGSGTILGVAVPGIAPLHATPGLAPPPQPQPPPQAKPQFSGTMLLEQAPIVPAPAPYVPEAAPAAPVVVARRGFPLAAVAIVASVLLLGGGGAILYFARSSNPLTATAKVSPEGKEQLHLVCEGCPDGTMATLSNGNGATASFTKHEADLDLATPLAIGDNAFSIALDRPGVGRDETVKLVLPLAYRIRGDLDGLAAATPELRVDVEAQKGATVTVDGKPVTLDASGKATLSYDVSADTTGEADDVRTLERKLPYEVVGKDKKKSQGEVLLRVAVMRLRVGAPGASLVTDQPRVWIAGVTSKGGVVTANGAPLTVAADGAFEGQVDVQDGAQKIVVRASPPEADAKKVAPRTTTVSVERVASLASEAAKLDKAPTPGGDALAGDPAAAVGQAAAITGSVIDARAEHHHAVLLVSDKRDCKTGLCVVRVEYGADVDVRAGDPVAAYGSVGKPISTPDGKTLPVVDATIVRKGTKK